MTIHQWLRAHHSHLSTYAPDEIARLAIAVGFPIEEVISATSDHFVHLSRIVKFWESPFVKNWVRVVMYEQGQDA